MPNWLRNAWRIWSDFDAGLSLAQKIWFWGSVFLGGGGLGAMPLLTEAIPWPFALLFAVVGLVAAVFIYSEVRSWRASRGSADRISGDRRPAFVSAPHGLTNATFENNQVSGNVDFLRAGRINGLEARGNIHTAHQISDESPIYIYHTRSMVEQLSGQPDRHYVEISNRGQTDLLNCEVLILKAHDGPQDNSLLEPYAIARFHDEASRIRASRIPPAGSIYVDIAHWDGHGYFKLTVPFEGALAGEMRAGDYPVMVRLKVKATASNTPGAEKTFVLREHAGNLLVMDVDNPSASLPPRPEMMTFSDAADYIRSDAVSLLTAMDYHARHVEAGAIVRRDNDVNLRIKRLLQYWNEAYPDQFPFAQSETRDGQGRKHMTQKVRKSQLDGILRQEGIPVPFE